MSQILVVDDDAAICRSLELQLTAQGHAVRTCGAVAGLSELLQDWVPEVALVDLRLPDGDGLSVMRDLLDRAPNCAVAIITGTQDMAATIQAIKQGAFDYLRKPINFDDVLLVIEKAAARRSEAEAVDETVLMTEQDLPATEIVGRDRQITEVIKQIGLLSQSRVTVLVTGDSGTGKELIARAIHNAGTPGQRFMPINCSSIVPSLLESDLFGHERGAFTDAVARKLGKLEIAEAGTVFLDEIGDLPLDLQPKLLRALQEREFSRVGGTEPIALRARVIAATHQDLRHLIAEERFREDLYYRLNVTSISAPPLCDRRGDIPLLVEHLLSKINRDLHKAVKRVPQELMAQFMSYDWPGNVRELENILTRGVALSLSETLEMDALQFPPDARPPVSRPESVKPLRDVERDHIAAVLALTDWNITQSSRLLGITPPTLRKKIADYGLQSRG